MADGQPRPLIATFNINGLRAVTGRTALTSFLRERRAAAAAAAGAGLGASGLDAPDPKQTGLGRPASSLAVAANGSEAVQSLNGAALAEAALADAPTDQHSLVVPRTNLREGESQSLGADAADAADATDATDASGVPESIGGDSLSETTARWPAQPPSSESSLKQPTPTLPAASASSSPPGLLGLGRSLDGAQASGFGPVRSQRSSLLFQLLDALQADIVCFQETKLTAAQVTEEMALVDGYDAFFSFSIAKDGYSGASWWMMQFSFVNWADWCSFWRFLLVGGEGLLTGVVTYCKKGIATPIAAQDGLTGRRVVKPPEPSSASVTSVPLQTGDVIKPDGLLPDYSDMDPTVLDALDSEGRCVVTDHDRFVLFNLYCPRADSAEGERMTFKKGPGMAHWLFSIRCVIVAGDFNLTHRRIDHCDPENYTTDDGSVDFEAHPSRRWMESFLAEGRVDCFRHFHPLLSSRYTCWRVDTRARETNYGTRIDYIVTDQALLPDISGCYHLTRFPGSDHCPVVITAAPTLRLTIPQRNPPKLCARYLPGMGGKTVQLTSFYRAKRSHPDADEEPSDVVPPQPPQHLQSVSAFASQSTRPASPQVPLPPPPPPPKRARSSSTPPSVVAPTGPKQKSLSAFFGSAKSTSAAPVAFKASPPPPSVKPENSLVSTPSNASSRSSSSSPLPAALSDCGADLTPSELAAITAATQSAAKTAWKQMLRGPAPPPRCTGHGEPCVERTVKNGSAQNIGRKFYVCGRPKGHTNNPEASCNFFKWI
ncbi:apurinic/apyrimidinic endonuclease 2, variant 1 [Capsaspora owczarzaki ATCC 30864]|uniref:DNA-(apurinic or apyrimidinic site) endonuclease n=1 Tax=Capsaspora owczarzaki (strain ATCC 30864) TaxID=595528 RepID=A0A0D2WH47_CAPO3|nr:apurinic/apyrimidinic endonuclease 2, variant 1 [Capsaspora owczarzaki ATCC 30864]